VFLPDGGVAMRIATSRDGVVVQADERRVVQKGLLNSLVGHWRDAGNGPVAQFHNVVGTLPNNVIVGGQDETLLLVAHLAIGVSWFYLGNPALACSHLEQMIALYDPVQHHTLAYRYGGMDPGMVGFGYYAWTLWMRGYPAQARAQNAKALNLAQQQAKSLELRAAMSLAACGSARGSASKPARCWRRSTAGSPRALTPLTCRRPKHCWGRCRKREHSLYGEPGAGACHARARQGCVMLALSQNSCSLRETCRAPHP
jgi:hypothetical protein